MHITHASSVTVIITTSRDRRMRINSKVLNVSGASQEDGSEPCDREALERHHVDAAQRLLTTEDARHDQHERPQEDDQAGAHVLTSIILPDVCTDLAWSVPVYVLHSIIICF